MPYEDPDRRGQPAGRNQRQGGDRHGQEVINAQAFSMQRDWGPVTAGLLSCLIPSVGDDRHQKPAVPSPPDLVVDLGVRRDRMFAGDQYVGETDETELLVSVARGLIRAAG